MDAMFSKAYEFNKPLNDWDTILVKDMSFMFYNAIKFNQSYFLCVKEQNGTIYYVIKWMFFSNI